LLHVRFKLDLLQKHLFQDSFLFALIVVVEWKSGPRRHCNIVNSLLPVQGSTPWWNEKLQRSWFIIHIALLPQQTGSCLKNELRLSWRITTDLFPVRRNTPWGKNELRFSLFNLISARRCLVNVLTIILVRDLQINEHGRLVHWDYWRLQWMLSLLLRS